MSGFVPVEKRYFNFWHTSCAHRRNWFFLLSIISTDTRVGEGELLTQVTKVAILVFRDVFPSNVNCC